MPKVTFLGAGSTVFANTLIGDLLSFPEFRDNLHISLHDINQERLSVSEQVAHQMAATLGATPTITAHLDRREALDGAGYALNMIQVGGYEPATVTDFEIPKKYGLRQTIADTLGIGGIMRAVRTIPVMLEFAADMEEVCPDAWLLNYTNPMAMCTWGVSEGSSIRTVGLCHSVFGTAGQLADRAGVPFEEVNYICAGINHMSFYLSFEHKGEDLYPAIKGTIGDTEKWKYDLVRMEVLRRLGYAVTESSEHFAEYVPWFIKRDNPELIEELQIPLDEYPRRCRDQIAGWNALQAKLLAGEELGEHNRSREYGSYIINSIETGTPRVVNANVMNHGLITNLPENCCVEVPCLVDGSGVQPTQIGDLPRQCAAVIRSNVNVQELTVAAVLENDRESLYHAAMMDPHTAAELVPDQIVDLVDELIDAHGEFIPEGLR
ncbi:MAG TPA: alpha-glucosidase/alpha-galactosidase [Armatimonadota bacterium]|jgi:alpha-galactosidase